MSSSDATHPAWEQAELAEAVRRDGATQAEVEASGAAMDVDGGGGRVEAAADAVVIVSVVAAATVIAASSAASWSSWMRSS